MQPCSASPGSSSSPSPSPSTTPETPCANCTTTDGRRCQFPFFIDGKEYNSCTLDLTAEGTTTPWGATRVDGAGNWLSRLGNTLLLLVQLLRCTGRAAMPMDSATLTVQWALWLVLSERSASRPPARKDTIQPTRRSSS